MHQYGDEPRTATGHPVPRGARSAEGSVSNGSSQTSMEGPDGLPRMLTPRTVVSAHCDLPCGVYDPAQARIEAESVKATCEKYQANTDPEFRTRALIIKEQRSELVKHHLWVLWTDYFKAPHFEKYPQLHQLFNEATKLAGARRQGFDRPGRGRASCSQDRRDREDLLGDQAGVSPPWPRHDPAGTSRGRAGRCRDGARTGRVRAGARAVPPDRRSSYGRPCSASARRCSATWRPSPTTSRWASRCGSSTSPPGRRARHLPGGSLRPTGRPRAPAPGARCSATLARICVAAATPAWNGWVLDWNSGRRLLRTPSGARAHGRLAALPAVRRGATRLAAHPATAA